MNTLRQKEDRRGIAIRMKHGDLDAVRAAIAAGQNVDAWSRAPDGRTALQWAAERGDVAAVRLLLAAGADPDRRSRYDEHALVIAIENVHADVVEVLLDSGASAKTRMEGGGYPGIESVLHLACEEVGDARIVQALLDHLAVDAPAPSGEEAIRLLRAASSAGHIEVVALLLAKGFAVSQGAIEDAWQAGHKAIVRKLLDAGFPPGTRQLDSPALCVAMRRGDLEVAQRLLAMGVPVSGRDVDGIRNCTPLHEAVRAGFTKGVSLLLEHGADVDAKDDRGRTALHEAVSGGMHECARLLLDAGADVNAPVSGGTLLHVAARCGQLGLVREILSRGVPISAPDENGYPAVYWAAQRGHLDVLREFLRRGEMSDSVLLRAVLGVDHDVSGSQSQRFRSESHALGKMAFAAGLCGHVETVRELLNRGAIIDADDSSALVRKAIQAGYCGLLEALLDAGIKLDLSIQSKDGETILHWCARTGQAGLVGRCIAAGVDANHTGASGWSALHEAVQRRRWRRPRRARPRDRENAAIQPIEWRGS